MLLPLGVAAAKNSGMTWANRITLLRLGLVPVWLACVMEYYLTGQEGWRMAAFWIFFSAAVSDGIDGYLARYHGQRTELGAFLDPMADKLLQLVGLFALTFIPFETLPRFPVWFALLIVGRDIVLLIGYLLLRQLQGHVYVRPHWSGKVGTACVFIAIAASLLRMQTLFMICSTITAVAALVSTGKYIAQGTDIYYTAWAVKRRTKS